MSTTRSQKYDFPDADATITSSDGVIYKVYKNYFPMLREVSVYPGEQDVFIRRREHSRVLDVIFDLIYSCSLQDSIPTLQALSYSDLLKCGSASQDFGIGWNGIALVLEAMKSKVNSWKLPNPNAAPPIQDIIGTISLCNEYCDYDPVINLLAPYMALEFPDKKLKFSSRFKWDSYTSRWQDEYRNAVSEVTAHVYNCQKCKERSFPHLKFDTTLLGDLSELFSSQGGCADLAEIGKEISGKIRAIPPLVKV